MQDKRLIKTFDGCYGRQGEIWVEKEKCELCGIEKICISSDGSEAEYVYVYICAECVSIECNKGLDEN